MTFQILALVLVTAASGNSDGLAGKMKKPEARRACLVDGLEEARALWNGKKEGLAGYDLFLRVRSYDSTTGDYVLKVRKGRGNEIVERETGKPPESGILEKVVKLDVDFLFESVERAIHENYDGVGVIFDFTYGFPSAIQFNPKKNIIEDDWELTADLTPYPEGFHLLED